MDNPYVMIVEDERITALEIQTRLKKKGYSVSGIATFGEPSRLIIVMRKKAPAP